MADATVIAVDPPPLPTTDYDSGLSVPPFDTAFFSQGDNQNDAVMADIDFDFSFDDLYIPSADELDDLLNPVQVQDFGFPSGQDAYFPQIAPSVDQFHAVANSDSSELRLVSGDADYSCDHSSNGSGVRNSASLGLEQIPGYLNVPSPESNGSNRETSEDCGGDAKVSNWPSPESQGSGNCESNVSEDSNNCATRSVSNSPNLNTKSVRMGVGNQKVKLDEQSKSMSNSSLLKRKKYSEELPYNAVESSKCKKSNCNLENSNNDNNDSVLSEEDVKRKARLVRNRESAQLSRQRKKHYVEELEEKVKTMHSTIQDLNVKISYFMAENATLRQQMGSGGGGAAPPPPMAPPPPGMYPHSAMMYPWMPYPPPYMMKQGSQVPLVPIPRLKPQQTVQVPKASKNKKNEGPKTKKVAGVSFLGLLFFVMLLGGLVPMVNLRYGGVRETLTGGESYVGGGSYEKHHGRVLMVNGTSYGDGRDFSSKLNPDGSVQSCNGSEPLVASLYVPRNDKLVKIDGNLIIHSVLASEKSVSAHGEGGGGDTGLAVHGNLGPSVPVPGMLIGGRLPQLKALGPGSADEVGKKLNATDGRLQQWFREGLAGPMLSSGMCTEVFQFDVSSASNSGAIFPSTTARNISQEHNRNSTHLSRSRNRRILRGLPIPLPESSHNISRRHARRNSQKDILNGDNPVTPMVVSVLVDPREVGGDADVDGVMGPKSLSRIFVVVLVDSVKYVTYSCMLPFKGSTQHLVAA
ncbi:tgacg-sequence-specific DNA-binding protein tga-1b [Phtheirospermum japonicum]|uniref:Tgacg-sequence-specific DNA-binding protein tga-1b n=1 Tax=Phtheirospermum japonicum TaxID=374723 RepID=A0A830BI43_9LAMI|nr:tgacg-sequence-specific DNA-binding protein tga-1b [Phtheirospermum japonicum]